MGTGYSLALGGALLILPALLIGGTLPNVTVVGLLILLMLIGGSPGSTAGGMKTTTAAVLLGTAVSTFGRQKYTHFFGRKYRSFWAPEAAGSARVIEIPP